MVIPKSSLSRFSRGSKRKDSEENSVPPLPAVLQSKPTPSVPASKFLKLGNLINPTKASVTASLEEFNIQTQSWMHPFTVKFTVDTEPFARGGFREVFKAFSAEKFYGDFVIKRFLPAEITERIIDQFNSLEEHSRKSVQMHSLARHLAQKFEQIVPEIFGETFKYTKLYFGKCELNGEASVVTIEKFLPGENFIKYVNNDGCIIEHPAIPVNKTES